MLKPGGMFRRLLMHGFSPARIALVTDTARAKREIKIFLEEWLPRSRAFSLSQGRKPKMSTGVVNHVDALHLC